MLSMVYFQNNKTKQKLHVLLRTVRIKTLKFKFETFLFVNAHPEY